MTYLLGGYWASRREGNGVLLSVIFALVNWMV